jgi:dihydrofolate reductase
MKFSIIAAVAQNGIIGIENRLPWHLPEDLAFFKKTTLGSPVLMGRKTYESINRPLPGRLNVVLSHNQAWAPAPAADGTPRPVLSTDQPPPPANTTGIAVFGNFHEALAWLRAYDQVFLMGGSRMYTQALEQGLVDELILTEIHQSFEGDAYFPAWSQEEFRETNRQKNEPTEQRAWGYDFVTYRKINQE